MNEALSAGVLWPLTWLVLFGVTKTHRPDLQKVYVIVGAWELLQISVSFPQQSDLLFQAVEQQLTLGHGGPLVSSDHLLHFIVLPLYGKQKLREDPLILLHDCLSRVLIEKKGFSLKLLEMDLGETDLNLLLLIQQPVSNPATS